MVGEHTPEEVMTGVQARMPKAPHLNGFFGTRPRSLLAAARSAEGFTRGPQVWHVPDRVGHEPQNSAAHASPPPFGAQAECQ
jgi:hypothetical protein